jgi:DNA-binding NtrC family response regulator
VVPLEVPPLRERREDVRLLADAFLASGASRREQSERGPRRIGREAMSALERHRWPGNVRELQNAIQRAALLCEGDVIGVGDLPAEVTEAGRAERLHEEVREGRLGFEDAVAAFEKELIRDALDHCAWNQTRAAERLHITRRLLKLKMDRHQLVGPPA